MDCHSTNGRVNIIQPNTSALFAMSDKIATNDKCSAYTDAMTGNWHSTTLSSTFFSQENVSALQYGIRSGVYEKSNGKYQIGNQSCDELKTIMRSIFLQHAINSPDNIWRSSPVQIPGTTWRDVGAVNYHGITVYKEL